MKNIVVFSDGTGQEGGVGANTNVYRLFNMIEDRTTRQIAFYDRGLGTGMRKLTGMAFGSGISKNIKECYEFIFQHYEKDDALYLFGFSRGAYTVRSLSGFIDLFGILPKSRPELIERAYQVYKTKDPEKRRRQRDVFLAGHHTMGTRIRCIGVWDTVGALGLPIKRPDMKHEFHDTSFCATVDAGFHALSIDDERRDFHPTVWNERTVRAGQHVEQVWFPGVHTDVGGGYPETGLADITLDWMVDRATDSGLLINPQHKVPVEPRPDGKIHDSRSGLGRLYLKEQRHAPEEIGVPKVHDSVYQRAESESDYRPWILDGAGERVST